MRTIKSFKDLLIWQKAELIFEMVYEDIHRWPQDVTSRALSYQLIRSAGSIGGNIAEGYGRGGPKEFEQFLRIARGSCAETDHWLYQSKMVRLISEKHFCEYEEVFGEFYKMLGAFINKLRLQKNSR